MEKRYETSVYKVGQLQEEAPLYDCEIANVAITDNERAEFVAIGEPERLKELFSKCGFDGDV